MALGVEVPDSVEEAEPVALCVLLALAVLVMEKVAVPVGEGLTVPVAQPV